jgi:hypothetical protein
MIPLRRFLPLPPEMVCYSVKGRFKSPIRSDFLINLPTLFLSDFYEFNHMVIKKSESRTESRKVIRVCIRLCGVPFSEERIRNAKRWEFLRTAVYLNRIRLVQNHIMFRATYYHVFILKLRYLASITKFK